MGEPEKNSDNENENKGSKFKTNFSIDEETCVVYVTLYKASKKSPTTRTLLIQAEKSKQVFNIAFLDYVLPVLNKEVKQSLSNEGKRNLRNN